MNPLINLVEETSGELTPSVSKLKRLVHIGRSIESSNKVSRMTMESYQQLTDEPLNKNYPINTYTVDGTDVNVDAAKSDVELAASKDAAKLTTHFYTKLRGFTENLSDTLDIASSNNLKNVSIIRDFGLDKVTSLVWDDESSDVDEYTQSFIDQITPSNGIFTQYKQLIEILPDSVCILSDVLNRFTKIDEMTHSELDAYLDSVNRKLTFRSIAKSVSSLQTALDVTDTIDIDVVIATQYFNRRMGQEISDVIHVASETWSSRSWLEELEINNIPESIQVETLPSDLCSKLCEVVERTVSYMNSIAEFTSVITTMNTIYSGAIDNITRKIQA